MTPRFRIGALCAAILASALIAVTQAPAARADCFIITIPFIGPVQICTP
ncbi:MAG: hypothetical protein QOF21_237 [Actinomycetota bacterium]|jgi:hypothetical protein